MKIQVGGLSEGIHQYHFHVEPSELELDGNFNQKIIVAADLQKTGTQLRLTATIEARGDFDCDRCATLFAKRLTSTYEMHYVADEDQATQFDPVEVQMISQGHQIIDITDDVRQTIVLAVPLKLLCRENCAGLCPRCAKNLNEGGCTCKDLPIDSRWEQLRRLRNN